MFGAIGGLFAEIESLSSFLELQGRYGVAPMTFAALSSRPSASPPRRCFSRGRGWRWNFGRSKRLKRCSAKTRRGSQMGSATALLVLVVIALVTNR